MIESSQFIESSTSKLDGFYDYWAILMEKLLQSHKYWGFIESGITVAPPDATKKQLKVVEESKLCDLNVYNCLSHSIDRSIMEIILMYNTAKDIRDVMQSKYHGSSKVKWDHL